MRSERPWPAGFLFTAWVCAFAPQVGLAVPAEEAVNTCSTAATGEFRKFSPPFRVDSQTREIVKNPLCERLWTFLFDRLRTTKDSTEGVFLDRRQKNPRAVDLARFLLGPSWLSDSLNNLPPSDSVQRTLNALAPQLYGKPDLVQVLYLRDFIQRNWVFSALTTPPVSSADKVLFVRTPGRAITVLYALNPDQIRKDREIARRTGYPSLRLFLWDELRETALSKAAWITMTGLGPLADLRAIPHWNDWVERARAWGPLLPRLVDLTYADRWIPGKPHGKPGEDAALFWKIYREDFVRHVRLAADAEYSGRNRLNPSVEDLELVALGASFLGGVAALPVLKGSATAVRWIRAALGARALQGMVGFNELIKALEAIPPRTAPGDGASSQDGLFSHVADGRWEVFRGYIDADGSLQTSTTFVVHLNGISI